MYICERGNDNLVPFLLLSPRKKILVFLWLYAAFCAKVAIITYLSGTTTILRAHACSRTKKILYILIFIFLSMFSFL